MFTDMQWVEQAGDVVGMEVFIVYGDGGHRAVVQVAEGVPDDPGVLSATVTGSQVSFDYPSENGGLRFTGQVTASGLVGTFGQERVNLDVPVTGSSPPS
jgi:hypothetical protein